MDASNLNRIGIVLNVVAGILMAPDLIGKIRLKKLEMILELKLKNMARRLTRLYEKFEPKFQILPFKDSNTPFFSPLTITIFTFICLIVSAVFWWIMSWVQISVLPDYFWWRVGLILLVSIVAIAILVASMVVGFEKEDFLGITIASLIATFSTLGWFLLLIVVWGIVIGLFFLLGYVLPKLLENLLNWTVSKMEKGEETVLSFMMMWGVTIFILGNLLQFLASLFEVKK
jgi:hypothetical protein